MSHIQWSLSRVRNRLRRASLTSHARGFLLRRKFTRSGLVIVQPGRPRVRITNHGGRIVCENVAFFPGVRLECFQDGYIFLGNGTYLNRNTEVISAKEVAIGRKCMISWDVLIMDTSQHGLGDQPSDARPISIGDRVWIGARAIILPGVTIGEGAVIGAASVVTRDVPPHTVAAGNPARIIRTL